MKRKQQKRDKFRSKYGVSIGLYKGEWKVIFTYTKQRRAVYLPFYFGHPQNKIKVIILDL